VAGRRRPGAAEQNVRIFSLPGFVADHGPIGFSSGSLACFFPHVRDPSLSLSLPEEHQNPTLSLSLSLSLSLFVFYNNIKNICALFLLLLLFLFKSFEERLFCVWSSL
jgi:hypothetical protein